MSFADDRSLPGNGSANGSGRGLAAVLRWTGFGLAVIALGAVAIWPASELAKPRTGLSGSEWRVVQIGEQAAAGFGTLRFTLTSIRGKAACSSFMGAFREIAGNIEIAGLGSTATLCDGRVDLEQAFLGSLIDARRYVLDGATLVLLDDAGHTLVKLAE